MADEYIMAKELLAKYDMEELLNHFSKMSGRVFTLMEKLAASDTYVGLTNPGMMSTYETVDDTVPSKYVITPMVAIPPLGVPCLHLGDWELIYCVLRSKKNRRTYEVSNRTVKNIADFSCCMVDNRSDRLDEKTLASIVLVSFMVISQFIRNEIGNIHPVDFMYQK